MSTLVKALFRSMFSTWCWLDLYACTIHESQSHTFTECISLPSPWTATSIFHISACLNVNRTLVTCVQMLWPPLCIRHIVFRHTAFITFSLLRDTCFISLCALTSTACTMVMHHCTKCVLWSPSCTRHNCFCFTVFRYACFSMSVLDYVRV